MPINRTLGRHTNDHMVSFYMASPSGFEVEYGWGARTVDDSTWQVQQHTTGSMWGTAPRRMSRYPPLKINWGRQEIQTARSSNSWQR